jgi:hypothetical protein
VGLAYQLSLSGSRVVVREGNTMSSLNDAAPSSEVGKAILIIAACYGALAEDADKRLAAHARDAG